MPPPRRRALHALTLAGGVAGRWIADDAGRVALGAFDGASCLDVPAEALRGCCVLLLSERQLPSVLAAIELDGIARRLLLCPPDLAPAHLSAIIAEAGVDAIVTDGSFPRPTAALPILSVTCRDRLDPMTCKKPERTTGTDWVLFSSGTTGRPKMIVHSLSSLTGPLDDGVGVSAGAVWSTFYDVRRYGGLQMLLRALIGGGAMVLSRAGEPVSTFLTRAGACGVTHISGTPSHWRLALLSPAARRIAPAYVRLSGEVADQAILDALRAAYPAAGIAHAFASTEAGVAFDVRDGFAGFPESFLHQPGARTKMRVQDGTLRIRSNRTAVQILGDPAADLRDADGFIDTGDMIEQRGDRLFFIGRREGVINVGGRKVHPEEVEAVINRHPDVHMSHVWARPSPVTGALVAADVVLRARDGDAPVAFAAIRDGIIADCRAALAPHKVPVTVRQVATLAVAASGKLVRAHASHPADG